MICAWKELMSILPLAIRPAVEQRSKDRLLEIRLRQGKAVQLVLPGGAESVRHTITQQDIQFAVNTASRYSPWASDGVASGFITAPGGHRIGLCGQAIIKGREFMGLRELTSLNIRVARDFPGIGERAGALSGNLLLLGSPGTGKTTLLRDIIRQISRQDRGSICVVDERMELFPVSQGSFCFDTGPNTDVLHGCGKEKGLEMALRTMGPSCIAVDEITSAEDCRALMGAGWCGVRLLATVHAQNRHDLLSRPVYAPLVSSCLFDWLVVLRPDRSWYSERMVT